MHSRLLLIPVALCFGVPSVGVTGQASPRYRPNPVIELLEQHKPVFGVYNPSNPSGRGRAGAPPPAAAVMKTPSELAKEALAYPAADFLFNGSSVALRAADSPLQIADCRLNCPRGTRTPQRLRVLARQRAAPASAAARAPSRSCIVDLVIQN